MRIVRTDSKKKKGIEKVLLGGILQSELCFVSYKWLKELVDIDMPSQELAEKMSTTGIEVEGVESPAAGLSKIVVGEVLSCEDVPETHLHVCQVNVGEEEARQIVCGAPNVRAGIKVMVALPGARIADNYKIKKGKSVAWSHLE